MKKQTKRTVQDELRPEYDFRSLRVVARGPGRKARAMPNPKKSRTMGFAGFYELSGVQHAVAKLVVSRFPKPVALEEIENLCKQFAAAHGGGKPADTKGRLKIFRLHPIFVNRVEDGESIKAELHPTVRKLIAEAKPEVLEKDVVLAALGLEQERLNGRVVQDKFVYAKTGEAWVRWEATPELEPSPKMKGPSPIKPGWTAKPGTAIANIAGGELPVDLRQNRIQEALCRYLASRYGSDNVQAEYRTPTGAVDVVVCHGSEFWFYEIKTADSARGCIREALAQLLEYSFWPTAREAERLIIVGEPLLDSDSRKFLILLKDRFSLPISYQQFDTVKGKLVSS